MALRHYVYARIAEIKDHSVHIVQLNGGKENWERTGIVTKIGVNSFAAKRNFGSGLTKEFTEPVGFLVNEAELFMKAARWSVGGFDMLINAKDLNNR